MLNPEWRHAYQELKPIVAVGESCVLTLVSVLLVYWFKPEQTCISATNLIWLIAGPILSGLRFGLIYALLSLSLIGLIALLASYYGFSCPHDNVKQIGLQLLLIAVIAGEFRNYWERRLKRLNVAALYLNERFTEVSHAFNMLKHSHDRLEQIQATKISLRDSLTSIRRKILLSYESNGNLSDLAPIILKSIADIGSLQGVSLHLMDAASRHVITEPIAVIGSPLPLDLHNPLLIKSIDTGKTAALKLDYIAENERSLLLSIPMVNAHGKLIGIIAVSKMPFRAYREDNIQLLSVMAGYIGDLLGRKLLPEKAIPNENLELFHVQCKRCMQDVLAFQLSASLIGFEFSNVQYADALADFIKRHQRGLDQFVALHNKYDNPILLMILPLTDQLNLKAYLSKLSQSIQAEFAAINQNELGFHYYFQVLDAHNTLADSLQKISFNLNIDNVFKTQ